MATYTISPETEHGGFDVAVLGMTAPGKLCWVKSLTVIPTHQVGSYLRSNDASILCRCREAIPLRKSARKANCSRVSFMASLSNLSEK